jgi:hypothetical protein
MPKAFTILVEVKPHPATEDTRPIAGFAVSHLQQLVDYFAERGHVTTFALEMGEEIAAHVSDTE